MEFEIRVAGCLHQLLDDAAIRRAGSTGWALTRTLLPGVGLGLIVVLLKPPVGY